MYRYEKNPIITRKDIPEIPPLLVDVSSVFNPGAVRYKDRYLLVLRVQNRGRETFFLTAESKDGVKFRVSKEIVRLDGIEEVKETVYHCYDPRITRINEDFFIMFAMDMESGCRLGLAKTRDFKAFEFRGVVSSEDNRNGVLFPQKIGGRYLRLDRPNERKVSEGPFTGDTIFLSESDDLLQWKPVGPVFSGRWHYWDELIGAGPPPIKTKEGWLLIYHGVALHLSCAHIYQAGAALLDLEDPGKAIARGRYNILEPRELYEVTGQVPNVVFPSGAVAEDVDEKGFAAMGSRVSVYYGAADTSVCVAYATIKDLIEAARA